jgi:hypothetical protein
MTDKDTKCGRMDEPVIERYQRFQLIDREGNISGLVYLSVTTKKIPERLVLECDKNHSNYYRIGTNES